MSLEALAKTVGIDWTNTYFDFGSGTKLDFEFDINPGDFLRFAQQDFHSRDRRGLVNTLTNAKRAIDCQVDKFCACIGYQPKSELPQNVKDYIKRRTIPNVRADVPQRLRLLHALDVAPPSLISKTRTIRNILEHEYKLPTEDEVVDAIELATLFIGTVNNVMNSFTDWYIIGNQPSMYAEDDRIANAINIFYKDADEGHHFEVTSIADQKHVEVRKISKLDHQYLELLRLTVAVSVKSNVESALYDFLQSINCFIPEHMVRVNLCW